MNYFYKYHNFYIIRIERIRWWFMVQYQALTISTWFECFNIVIQIVWKDQQLLRVVAYKLYLLYFLSLLHRQYQTFLLLNLLHMFYYSFTKFSILNTHNLRYWRFLHLFIFYIDYQQSILILRKLYLLLSCPKTTLCTFC
jgi:hypothetical protein